MSNRQTSGRGSCFAWKKRDPKTGELVQVGWCAVADVGRIDGKRKRLTRYAGMGKKRELADWLNDTLRDRKHDELPRQGRETVAGWMATWLEGLDVRPRTREHYEGNVRLHICGPKGIGAIALAKLTAADVEKFLAERRRAGLAPRTVHHLRAILRNALRKAVRDRLIAHNVASEADAPKVAQLEMQTLTPEQVKIFLAAVKPRRLEALYVITLALGLRQGEALGLRWSDINLDAGTLRVTRSLQWIRPAGQRRAEPMLVEPKSQTSRRALALPAVALEALRAHRKRWVDEKLRLGDRYLNTWDLVFVTEAGLPINPKAVWTEFHEEILAGAGLPLIRFHDLRHSAASLLLLHGVPARMVQEILGHSSISLTLGTYSHVLPGLREQATAAMDAVLGG